MRYLVTRTWTVESESALTATARARPGQHEQSHIQYIDDGAEASVGYQAFLQQQEEGSDVYRWNCNAHDHYSFGRWTNFDAALSGMRTHNKRNH